MAKITAKGTADFFGKIEVVIEGDRTVEKITCDDDDVREFFEKSIKNGDGEMANAYHPEPNTMLQALAFCISMLPQGKVTVEGDIGEIESEEGVIY